MDPNYLKTIQKNFLKELKAAKAGKKTSLAFIIHQLAKTQIAQEGEVFQVLVTGGSVCKEADVRYKDGKLKILRKQEMSCGSFDTKKDFLEFVWKNLSKETKTLAVNFTFPIKPVLRNNTLDGTLINGTKEHIFKGLVGQKVGEEIEKYIYQKVGRKIKVAVANDTICLLLSALTQYSWDQIAAGVVGTGVNFAIFSGENNLVNLESGNFNKFSVSEYTKEIDKKTTNPDMQLFEKEVAGAYLYKQFNLIIKEKGIDYPPISSTAELNSVANKNLPGISQIAIDLFEKSAGLVTCQIAAITQFAHKDLIFIMEGSLFWHSLRPKVERYLKQLLPGHKTRFAKIENSEIFGAARLVS